MKIGILSQWYDPEPGPAALPGVYAREMVRAGHSVQALTGFPNYPDGELYDGYRMKRHSVEQRDGVDVHRVALYPEHSGSALGRVLNYASFASSAAVSGRSALRGVDAIWVYNSPVTVSLPLLMHSKRGKIPYFLHVQDLWPESLIESGMVPDGWVGDRAAAIIRRIVALTERKACAVGVISRGVRDLILQRHPELDPGRLVYAPNPTNEQLFTSLLARKRAELPAQESRDEVSVMYAGAVGEVQGLDIVLDAAKHLRGTRVKFVIYGDGISRVRLQERVTSESIDNVQFLGRVPQDEVPELIARADIQLVSLARSAFLEHTTPSKIPSLLASGVPIVAQIAGDGARMIDEAGAGVVATPGDAVQLAEAIRTMADAGPAEWLEYGQRGRDYYDSYLSAAATTAIILDRLHAAVAANDK